MTESVKKNLGLSPQVREVNFQLAEQVFRCWAFKAPHNTKFENLLEPRFWAGVAGKLQQWDTIVVQSEDFSFYAKLLVMNVEKFAVQVGKLEYYEIDKLQTKTDKSLLALSESDYEIAFESKSKWRVIRKSDRVIVCQGFNDKKQAERALDDYIKRLTPAE